MMTQLLLLAREALEQMPAETRLRPEDTQVILQHKDVLLSWSRELLQTFFDTLFAHPPTRRIFREGERPDRETTFLAWWERTVEGPLDEEYFAWMAKVGLAHVVRGVESPMMLAMASFVASFVDKQAQSLSLPGAEALAGAFYRLSTTLGAVITHAYVRYRTLALHRVAGMEPPLLERLIVAEAEGILESIRKE
ncbi:hypothetical protein HRbin38_00031 [bacterium HR38]|uniref:Globin domain protein n=3 Tax=Thermus scotoductus TaxID=37636 RepID=A0A430RGC3_THESC|nr:putative methyl-accepting chemotaxis sensory transducer [Thermus scotoductus SA-01]RTH07016.1 globin domain protein [Thermus scotoductus]GBD40177.1 hypothetical protein HRbin38_00031 [bacterium HR38]